MAPPTSGRIRHRADEFSRGVKEFHPVDFGRWLDAIDSSIAQDAQLRAAFSRCDLVLVNGEGTIHHNLPRALALLGIIEAARRAGRGVVLMNATIQAIDPDIARHALRNLVFAHSRERLTWNYLSTLGIESVCAGDIAFDFSLRRMETFRESNSDVRRSALITGGVIARRDAMTAIIGAVRAVGFDPVYFCIGDGGEEGVARATCSELNVPVTMASEVGLERLFAFLRKFRIAVSGRHHMNIFLMAAGLPFVPIPSNTWKIEGTLKLVDYPIPVANSFAELAHALEQLIGDERAFTAAAERAHENGRSTLRNLRKDLRTCMS